MRVGVDGTFLQAEVRHTGMGVYSRELVAALAALPGGPELTLLGYGPRPAGLPEAAPWHRLPLPPAGKLAPWLGHQTGLPLAARRLGLDVLHVPGVNVRLSQPGLPGWSPCPLVVTLHDVIPLAYYGRQGPPLPWRLRLAYRLATLALRRAAAVITVSHAARRDIVAHLRLRPDRLHVVHNGVRFAWPTDEMALPLLAARGVRPPYLLYAGSYEPRKNLLGAVDAYRRARGLADLPPLVLLLERDSGHRTAAMAALERSGVADHLTIIHSLTDDEQGALYRHAALMIYPSFYEGFGFVPLQALACGTPVIAARASSLPEVLGEAVRYVDLADPDDLATAIVELWRDRAAALALAARGPAQAGRFRWSETATRTYIAYEAALGGPHSASAMMADESAGR
jgi:glycosyltransferase involved in cell wall biosynthesis